MFHLRMFMSSFNSLDFLCQLKVFFGINNMIRILSMASSESVVLTGFDCKKVLQTAAVSIKL